MKFYKYVILFIATVSLFSCSDDSDEQKTTVSISSTRTFIGDTLTFTGENLDKLGSISIFNEEIDEIFSTQPPIIYKSDTKIKFIVPELRHHKAKIYMGPSFDPIDIEVYGYIPYSFANNGSVFRESEAVQLLDDFAYCQNTRYGQKFKLMNDFSDVEYLPKINTALKVRLYHYTNETSGYQLIQGDSGFKVYSFSNEINNRNFEYAMSKEIFDNFYSSWNWRFVSKKQAYCIYNGEMYQVDNGELTILNDLYPELRSILGATEITAFELLEDDSMILVPSSNTYMLKIKNGIVSKIDFPVKVSYSNRFGTMNPIFKDNRGGFYSSTDHKVYRTNDYGLTWTSHDVNFPKGDDSYFNYLGDGQLIVHVHVNPNDINMRARYVSTDNGASWFIIQHSRKYSDLQKMKISGEFGIAKSGGYGLIKYRRFPRGYKPN